MAEFVGGDVENIKIGDGINLSGKMSMNCNTKKIYQVVKLTPDIVEVTERKVVYQSKNSYFIYDEEFDTVKEVKKDLVQITNDGFKAMYCGELTRDLLSFTIGYFESKELSEEFIESVKKYGDIWFLEQQLNIMKKRKDYAKKDLKEIEDEILKLNKNLEVKKNNLRGYHNE